MSNKASYKELEKQIEKLKQQARERARIEDELQYRLKFEALITAISSKFINLHTDEIDAEVENALKAIGEFTQVDRSYIFRYSEDGLKIDNTHEWCAPGVASHIHRLKNLPLTQFPWLIEQISATRVVHIPDPSRLPQKATSLKKELELEGIQSLVIVPTTYAGAIIGFLGFDSIREQKTWPSDSIALLRIAGEILANATERKKAEIALRRSEEKYRTILDTIEDGYWEIDLSGRITFFNESLSRIFEYSHEELMGLSFKDYATAPVAERLYKVFNEIYRTGKSAEVSDYEMINKNGQQVFMEFTAALMRDAAGNPIGFRGVTRNVTERKLAEKALRESEKRYRTVLEANPDPVVVYDTAGRVVYFNPAFETVFKWQLDEWQRKELKGFLPSPQGRDSDETTQLLLAGKSFTGIVTERLSSDGELIPVSISGAVYKDENQSPIGSVLAIRDIREKKRLEAQLVNAQKMEALGTLAGGIAHDFNNLLMAVQGNASLALFDLESGHPHHRLFENIQKSAQKGSKLTAQLLGYARKGRYEVKPIDLNRMVRDVADTFGRTRKEISVHYDLALDLAPIEADEGQIEQVLLNMFVNAGHAMQDGGELFLKTENVGHEALYGELYQPVPGRYSFLEIIDSGVGMDQETIEHIFEPFFTTKEMGRGTGLGLASAYGIIKGHGGYINVTSEPGTGSSFKIYFPSSAKKLSQDNAKSDKPVKGNETILLVDDEEMVLSVGVKTLEKLGYAVLAAQNGQEAVDVYRANKDKIDLVILDIVMPIMGGGQAFDLMREINPKVKVLLSSGYSIEGQATDILNRGCNGFIQKPFKINDLSDKIIEIMKP
jgi:two-component system, cell cycle sensor histidine kinase and response regulator CckA